jgi:hypothetical protein
MCKQGLLVDPAKIVVIVNLPPPKSVRQLKSTFGHIGYYRNFIRGYAQITTPMENCASGKLCIWKIVHMENCEPSNLEDNFPDAQFFSV